MCNSEKIISITFLKFYFAELFSADHKEAWLTNISLADRRSLRRQREDSWRGWGNLFPVALGEIGCISMGVGNLLGSQLSCSSSDVTRELRTHFGV